MRNLADCVVELEKFTEGNLTLKLRDIEDHLTKGDASACKEINENFSINLDLLEAAAALKKAAAQIDVMIHSIGILHLLPLILDEGETVEYLSLGAGNTGKKFDLETDRQIAEFTFIAWRGGSEVIRQNKLFVDFYHLAEAKTQKARNLYVLGIHHPEKFFNCRRALSSVLMKQPAIAGDLFSLYGDSFKVVNDYYRHHVGTVKICDISEFVPRSLLAAIE